MSRRSIIRKFQVFTDEDTATSPLSIPSDISGVDSITYQLSIASTVNALMEIHFSNDDKFDTSLTKILNFGQTTPLLGSAGEDYTVHISNKGFKWLQVRVIDNSGSGNINAWITGTVGGA
jgi:hypothetical protein